MSLSERRRRNRIQSRSYGLPGGTVATRRPGWRGAGVMAAVCAVLVIAGALVTGVVTGGSDSAWAARASRSGDASGNLTGSSLAGVRRLEQTKAAARGRWLASPEVRAQRVASQMRFHDLTGADAKRLLGREYGSALSAASANPAASIARSGRIVRYLGDYRAIVRTAHGLELKVSSVPLRVAAKDGAERPVDLALTPKAGGFAPATPVTPVSIGQDSDGGVAIGSDGLRVTLEGADVTGDSMGGQSVFFPSVGRDMDASVAPTLTGAELFALLRSRLSPEQLRYRVTLPAGAVLRSVAGGAVISRSSTTLARIPSPSARDAQGVQVPVRMRVAGDELVLSVEHRGLQVAYPVLVDPSVVTITKSAEGWAFIQTGLDNFAGSFPGGSAGLSISAPKQTYPALYEGKAVAESSGAWKISPPLTPEFVAVEFDGTSFSATSENGKHESTTGVYWEVTACNQGDGGYINFSPAPEAVIKFFGERGTSRNCEDPVRVYLLDGGEGNTVSGSVSVAAIVMTARWHILEGHLGEEYGPSNPGKPEHSHCQIGKPVNCATGDETETQTDLSVGGRGPGLKLRRTYNSQLAAKQTAAGPFGYGWTGSYSAHIIFGHTCESCATETATVYQDNGSTIYYEYLNEQWVAAAPLVEATLVKEGTSYIYTLPNQIKLEFSSAGQLTKEIDRNGNAVTVAYNSESRLESATDGAGRKLTFAYNSNGQIESVKDPTGHVVKYTYESENLASVTLPGEEVARWKFKYNASHELTELTDGRGNAITTEYNGSHQVVAQTDALGRARKWKYGTITEGTYTEVTEPNGGVTRDEFNLQDLPISVTHAYGTSLAATTTYEYEGLFNRIAVTDPDKHTTKYTYDGAGDRTSETNADGDETKWTYDTTHDVLSTTTPDGEATTIKRNSDGAPEVIESPAPGGKTQKSTYKYDSKGDLESFTDPLEHTWKFEYDSYGDRIAEIDPESNKRTWGYNEDSQETAMVSPRGNVSGGKPAEFTTTIERDALGRPVKVIEPGPSGSGKPSIRVQASISGVAQEAQTLTAATGIWAGTPSLSYSYQWQHCNSSGGSCTNLSEATGPTYVLGAGDVGNTMRVVVTATNTSGSATSTSEAIPVVVSAVVWGYEFGSASLHHPDGAAIDAHGRVWVTSSGGEPWLQEFSREGEQLATYGATGTAKGDFEDPNGIAINKSTGAVYVSDGSNDRIQEYSEAGVAGKEIGKKGSAAGDFEKPVAVALDSSGNIWAADYTGQRIDEFNKEGTFLKAFGWGVNKGEAKLEVCTTSCKAGKAGTGEGELDNPAGIEYAGEDIHVVDSGADRLQKFNTAGEYIGDGGGEGSGNGQLSHPTNETTEVEGNSYVADAGNNRVEEFTGHAGFVDTFGSSGTGWGQFSEPGDVAINATVSELFVTDIGNNRVEKWDSTTLPAFSATIGSGDFTHPGDVAVDPKGRIWATNAKGNPAIQVFSSSGTREATYGEHGTEAEKGKYVEPDGITINQSTSNVYVADGGAGRIDELSEKGVIVKEIGAKGTGAGQMADPVALALDPSGDIYVADRTGQRIEEFNKEGTFVKAFGFAVNKGEEKLEVCTTSCKEGKAGSALGQFNDPTGIVYTDGYLHIVDGGNDRLEKFSLAGEYEGHASGEGSGNGQLSHPLNVTASAGGNMYVADAANNRIEEFTPLGAFVAAFGSVGSAGGQLNTPTGVAVGPNEELYVSDAENNRLQKWLPAGSPVDTAVPAISGEILVGQTLTASTGTWSALPAPSYTYQWQHCNAAGASCSNISGATSATYALTSGDEGYTLEVVVTATNSAGSASSSSAATELVGTAATHVTEYHYDPNGNVESVTDPNGHTTRYTYDAANEPTKVKESNGTITETEYDAMGHVKSQTDGNKHTTKYERNLLEEITEEIDPQGRKTKKEYDAAGNLKTLEDVEKRTTTYTYDPANLLTEVGYSSGKPATIKYENNKDGDRIKLVDGSGTTKYEYDQLDRLTETENGHKEKVKYEYNLANEQAKITYPNEKAVTREYDKDERLDKVTDWNKKETTFSYNPDSELEKTTFPGETKDEDTYAYNDADEMSEVKMLKGTETLASLAYTRDGDEQVATVISNGLPGEEKSTYEYDTDNRLAKGAGTTYEYDAAYNPTKLGASTYKYGGADELESSTGFTYADNEDGQRTKATPTTGPAITYAYDQAGNLTAIARPEGESKPKIEDSYTYNGEGLRVSQTISGATTYMTWDIAEETPLLLNDGTNSYIYGPDDLPIEQINSSTGTATYLHHDQAGSTRLLTGATGTATGKCTYAPYGAATCEGSTATPLGYDAQYTSPDTGLIYMRARVYDPATAQFLSRDPMATITGEPYSYVGDDPVAYADRRGLAGESVGEGPSCPPEFCLHLPTHEEAQHAAEALEGLVHGVVHGTESVVNWITSEGESSNEGTETVQGSECGYDSEQNALIKIAKESKRTGVSREEAEILREWADEFDVPFRGPEEHPGRPFGSQPHIHVGSQNHIPVW
jgi:RHS repeat-associated protein